MNVDRLSFIERGFGICDVCERELRDVQATVADHDCATCGGEIAEHKYVPASQLAGAVSLTDEQWERVLWWLHKPVAPGPAKALDESIIRAINTQRGQSW